MVRQSHQIVDKSRCSMSPFAPKSQNMRALKLKIKIHLPEHWDIITARDRSNSSRGPKTLCFSNKMTKNYLKSLCHLVSKGLLRPCRTSAVRTASAGDWAHSRYQLRRFLTSYSRDLANSNKIFKALFSELGRWIFCLLRRFKFQGPCLNSGKQSKSI